MGMRDTNPRVLIVDDNPEFRESVGRLLRSVDLDTRQFSSIADFLKTELPDDPTCLVVDVRMPGQSGLKLQGDSSPATGNSRSFSSPRTGDVPMTVQAMKAGAIEFLTKPLRDQDLLEAIEADFARDRARRERESAVDEFRNRFDSLTAREREIMIQATAGRLNKQIAHDIGVTESTVKVHRSNVMRKMKPVRFPS